MLLFMHSSALFLGYFGLNVFIHLHVNKTNFHAKGFALSLALKQTRNATRRSPISQFHNHAQSVRAWHQSEA